eukprot:gene32457-42046_t
MRMIQQQQEEGQPTVGDLDDIILKASLYGIHHPVTYHSFCNSAYLTAPSLLVSALSSSVFVPSSCLACEQIVFPFLNSCICLRCRSVAHRSCLLKVTVKCSAALFQGLESNGTLQSADTSIITLERDLEAIVSKVCLIPKVLKYIPEPASEFCIWQTIVRAVIQRFPTAHQRRPKPFSLHDADKAVAAVTRMLDDSSSLPGQLVRVLHGTFVAIDFALSDEEALRHARECLDTLAFSLLSYLHLDKVCNSNDDAVLREAICHTSDKYMLSVHNVSICEDVLSTVNELSIALVESKLVIDKLNILVKILQTLSAVRSTPIIPMQSSMESSTINNSNSCADKKEDENSATTYYSATNSSTINMENPTNEDEARSSVPTIMKSSGSASTDTDELLESLCNVIQWSMATNDDDDDERVQIKDNDRASSTASSTISKSTKTRDTFLISNSNNKKYTSNIHWLAEFAYMSCSVLLRDLDS